jgi:hypothetical protein
MPRVHRHFAAVAFALSALAGQSTPPPATPATPAAPPVTHRVLLQGDGRLAILDRRGEIEWEMPWGGIHDVHRLADGHDDRAGEHDARGRDRSRAPSRSCGATTRPRRTATPASASRCTRSCRSPTGNLLIAESGPSRCIDDRSRGPAAAHAAAHGGRRPTRTATRGSCDGWRMVNVLVCHEGDGAVREYDGTSGKVVWQFVVPMFGKAAKDGHGPEAFGNQVFGALRLPSGNTLIATGNGHSVLEVERQGQTSSGRCSSATCPASCSRG